MPRQPRVYVKGSLYYITCRSLPNQSIFREPEDYKMYFELLKKCKNESGIKVYAYTLMPNHLHLLLETDENTSISQVMHTLNSKYTKYFNGRYSRKGHLFRERYKAAFIENEPKLLLNLTAYIHLNCEHLNLSVKAQTYPYSSYSLYLNCQQEGPQGLEIKEEITRILSSLAGENYADFVEKLSKAEELKSMHSQLQRKKIVGSEEFIEKVKKEMETYQQQNESQDEDEDEGNQGNFLNAGTALLIFVLTVSGMYVYFNFSRPSPKVTQAEQKEQTVVVQQAVRDLSNTEWQTRVLLPDGSLASNDVLSFINGKFSSSYLSQFSFQQTNYSVVIEDNKIIWETMQTINNDTASWRGEVGPDGVMRGILSLRQEGKEPQDFTFQSLKYRRK